SDESRTGSSCGVMATSRTRPQRLPVELYTGEPSSSESATTAIGDSFFAEYESPCNLAIYNSKKIAAPALPPFAAPETRRFDICSDEVQTAPSRANARVA